MICKEIAAGINKDYQTYDLTFKQAREEGAKILSPVNALGVAVVFKNVLKVLNILVTQALAGLKST